MLGQGSSPEAEPRIGQRGRQRAILREGVYAINLAQFLVITEEAVYRLDLAGQRELKTLVGWQNELNEIAGFSPVVIGGPVECPDPFIPDKKQYVDSMGIVTIMDGPSLAPGEIIAPAVGYDRTDKDYHNTNYQDTEAFLRRAGVASRPAIPCRSRTAPTSSTDGSPRSNPSRRWSCRLDTSAWS